MRATVFVHGCGRKYMTFKNVDTARDARKSRKIFICRTPQREAVIAATTKPFRNYALKRRIYGPQKGGRLDIENRIRYDKSYCCTFTAVESSSNGFKFK
jgi:hypothetical protein